MLCVVYAMIPIKEHLEVVHLSFQKWPEFHVASPYVLCRERWGRGGERERGREREGGSQKNRKRGKEGEREEELYLTMLLRFPLCLKPTYLGRGC